MDSPLSNNPNSLVVDNLPKTAVGPGCSRIDLPGHPFVRTWIVDIEAGQQWPHVDVHDKLGEIVYVVSGELIEGDRRYGPGSFLYYGPHSSHRPRSEHGVRLFGFNIISDHFDG